MAGGKTASPAQSNPNEGPAGLSLLVPLFLFLSAAVNLISETYQTDADRASLANTKKKIFMCLQISKYNNASIQVFGMQDVFRSTPDTADAFIFIVASLNT